MVRATFRRLAGVGAVTVGLAAMMAAPASAVPLWPDAGLGAWGAGALGQMGDGNTNTTNSVPQVTDASGVLSGKVVTSVSVGNNFACAVASGAAFCWGQRSAGKLGDGGATTGQTNTPVAVSTSGVMSGKTITTVSAGGGSACALDTAGSAYCWGAGSQGQLGNGGSSNVGSPVAVTMPAGKVFTSIAVGFTHACASTSDGLAYCWGSNDAGQLGIGSTSPSTTPVAVDMTGSLASTTVTSITAGYSYSCVVASGAAYCWGQQEGGKLGNNDGTAFSRTTPVPVYTGGHLSGLTVTAIAAGGTSSPSAPATPGTQGSTCAIANGDAYCWGYGGSGRLGTGNTSNSYVALPVYKGGALSGKSIRTISVGWNNACASTTDFGVYCWGSSASGQVGNGTLTSSNVPVAASTPDAFKVNYSSTGAARPVLSVSAGKDVSAAVYGYAAMPGSLTAAYTEPNLSWSAPAYLGTSSTTYYLLTYRLSSDTSGAFKTFMKVPAATTAIDLEGYASAGCPAGATCVRAYGALLPSTSYDFRVSAMNVSGNGRASGTVVVSWTP